MKTKAKTHIIVSGNNFFPKRKGEKTWNSNHPISSKNWERHFVPRTNDKVNILFVCFVCSIPIGDGFSWLHFFSIRTDACWVWMRVVCTQWPAFHWIVSVNDTIIASTSPFRFCFISFISSMTNEYFWLVLQSLLPSHSQLKARVCFAVHSKYSETIEIRDMTFL